MERVYFVSSSKNKFEEIKAVLGAGGAMNLKLDAKWENINIPKLQTGDSEKLVRAKALSAFTELRRPVLVEHTALNIHAFSGLPSLQTNLFYSRIGYQGIVEYCRFKNNFKADAKSILCFCDGKKYDIGHGKESDWIKESLNSVKDEFAWDSIFYPEADNIDWKTYQKMGNQKNDQSIRKKPGMICNRSCSSNCFRPGCRKWRRSMSLCRLSKSEKCSCSLGRESQHRLADSHLGEI